MKKSVLTSNISFSCDTGILGVLDVKIKKKNLALFQKHLEEILFLIKKVKSPKAIKLI